jgi:multidrug efflux pump subunit AcrA (membrane-fusion protein)
MQTNQAKSALHKKFHPPHGGNATLGHSPQRQMLSIIGGNFNEQTVRTKFVQLALSQNGINGVCFLQRGAEALWQPAISFPSSGRIPSRKDFDDAVSEKCDGFIKSPTLQTHEFSNAKMVGAMMPLRVRSGDPEILFTSFSSKREALLATTFIQEMASAIQIWLNSRVAADSDWQVVALGSIIELISKIEQQSTVKEACEEATNVLANRIGCDSVAIGLLERGRMKLKAISGVSKLDHGSDSSQQFLQALRESVTRKEEAVFPPVDDNNNFLLQAHKQLAAGTLVGAVRSHPLTNVGGQTIGAIVYTGPEKLLHSSQVDRFCKSSVAPLAGSLTVVSKVRQGAIAKTQTYVRRKMSATKQFAILALLIAFGLLMFLPITYRVRCDCVVEADSRRFAVAPFEGQILVGHKEAGDFVKAGDLLAEMDGRTIRWELAGITAERDQSVRTREIELSDRNVPKTILAELEYERLTSEESVLKYKRDHLQIKSPVDGVVLSGSLERAEAASVKTGQVLFEIGPLSPVQIEVAVPDDEIEHVKVGSVVKVWIDGQESDPLEGEITKIHPRSETRNADNVFIAEVQFENKEERLRPGMKGSARISCQKRPLGWCLFHKPYNWMQSRLTWW